MATRQVYFSDNGTPKTGLTLTWEALKKVSDGSDFTPLPTFTEIAEGWYKFDINPTEALVGVIDGSATLGNASDRFVPVFFDQFDFLFESKATPVFDEDTDSITFMAFLLQNGKILTTLLTACEIKVFDQAHTLLFTISSGANTNGVFVITKSTPGLTKNKNFYTIIKITHDGTDHETTDSFIALE